MCIRDRLIEDDASVGYRNRYYICRDHRIKQKASGGAVNTEICYFQIPVGSADMNLKDQYIYDGMEEKVYTHIDSSGNSMEITEEEYLFYDSDEDVDFDSEWELLFEGQTIHYVE